MVRRGAVFLGAALLMASVVPCVPADAAGRPAVRVGSEVEFPPYAFMRDGKLVGYSIDLIEAVAETMGLDIESSTGTWDAQWDALVAGRLDVLPIVAILPERRSLVEFSVPHTRTFDAFFVAKGRPPIHSLQEAENLEIVVMRSDAAHHALLERGFRGRLVPVATIPEGLALVAAGKHDAFLGSKLIGVMAIKTHGLRGLKPGPPIREYERVFAFGVKKGRRDLLERLNEGLLIVNTNGEYDRIYGRWLSFDDPWRKLEKHLLPAAGLALAVVLLAGLWLVLLRREVAQRTAALKRSSRALEALGRCNEAVVRAIDEPALLESVCGTIVSVAGHRLAWVGYPVDDERKTVRPVSSAGCDDGFLKEADITWADDERGRGPEGTAIRTKAVDLCRDLVRDPRMAPWRSRAARCGYASAVALPLCAEGRVLGALTIYSGGTDAFDEGEVAMLRELSENLAFGIASLRARSERAATLKELARSNAELEQFAYVASHHLKEPLRTITSFSQLLARRYGGRLDAEADEFIGFTVEGAATMQRHIDDLLSFSRARALERSIAAVDCERVLSEALSGLKAQVDESRGRVAHDPLPVVQADACRLQQVLQNLVANALKFRGERPPIVHVSARRTGDDWVFSVRDNGIGIEPRHFESIFRIFHRLHPKGEFPGNGLGLAICKQAVEAQGGRIWVESRPGKGSTFYFTIPARA
ncbi:MAG: transporter substrate-binding domain-containing protein [Elusimicrobia bacterium]|nr:transporter substrate-binding domain-containing protein [Elusimicrobiota bacterium]